MCHQPVPRTGSHAMVPFFGLERCGDKCGPAQKPEARSGFPKTESVDAVVCCQGWVGSQTQGAGKGQTRGLSPADSPRRWFLWEALCSFSSRSAVVSAGAAPSSLTLSELLTEGAGSVSGRVLRGDGVSCARWNWSLSGSCLHL